MHIECGEGADFNIFYILRADEAVAEVWWRDIWNFPVFCVSLYRPIHYAMKISFCITCMNRLEHLRKTLERNILDNLLEGEVEFVLLDYHSTDGLPEWVRQHMGSYINRGLLNYYRTEEPQHYLRSHSRNMAFRLAQGDILCNLDADNFLGKGFARFMLDAFDREKGIFYISSLVNRDVFGRVCLTQADYLAVRGYDEALVGYGMEDADLFDRLLKQGLEQRVFLQPEFYGAIEHPDEQRVGEEPLLKGLHSIYLDYIDPCTTRVWMFHQDGRCEWGTLANNRRRYHNLNHVPKGVGYCMDSRLRVVIEGEWHTGHWQDAATHVVLTGAAQETHLAKNAQGLLLCDRLLYRVVEKEAEIEVVMTVAEALNFKQVTDTLRRERDTNPQGFGKGVVYKNFETIPILIHQQPFFPAINH